MRFLEGVEVPLSFLLLGTDEGLAWGSWCLPDQEENALLFLFVRQASLGPLDVCIGLRRAEPGGAS